MFFSLLWKKGAGTPYRRVPSQKSHGLKFVLLYFIVESDWYIWLNREATSNRYNSCTLTTLCCKKILRPYLVWIILLLYPGLVLSLSCCKQCRSYIATFKIYVRHVP